MDDVISLSSGNEEDSDVEFIGSYRDGDCNGIPFIKAELLPVTPVLIDITERHFSPNKPKPRTIEVIDLNSISESRVRHQAKSRNTMKLSPYTLNLEEDVICLDPGDGNGGQSPVQLSYNPENDFIQACLEASRVVEDSQLSTTKDITLSHEPSDGLLEFFEAQNTNHTQQTSPSPLVKKNADHGSVDSSHSWLNEEVSPLNVSDSYNCPSEVDVAVFSDESLFLHDDDDKRKRTSGYIQAKSSLFEIGESLAAQENPPAHASSPHPQTQTNFQPAFQMLPTSDQALLAASPTSTELLAGDSAETGSDLDMESPPISPVKSSYTPSPLPHMPLDIKDSASVLQDDDTGADADTGTDADASGLSERRTEEAQQISLVQFKKLKYVLGARDQELYAADEDSKEFGMAEPLSRQSLSLVYSTIDENYTDGTLQLLSDLIQPCYYPPAHITSHLLREVLLEPHCSRERSLEAYNLLMRTQKYHPADKFTIAWDWELLSSVMAEQDKARRLHGEVRCLLLQYVLQVLEDDFHFKLPMLRLHLTIASEMLSCDHSFRQVRELVTWLLDEAKQSFCTSEDEGMQKRERNCCLKMLLILQRMLLLAMEVDLRPTCSSSKLSQELCNSLNCMAPCRRLRFLLLSTLQSNLLRCKMVELLLDQSCSQKRVLPMSFKLLLHFLQTSTPTPDPSDGTERWRRWDEILQLVWMLMISYQEVITGHLRYSITERFKLSRPPMWTQNDQVTRAAVQEAAEAFLSRAVKDLGHDLPIQVQESLSQLQEHLLSISLQ